MVAKSKAESSTFNNDDFNDDFNNRLCWPCTNDDFNDLNDDDLNNSKVVPLVVLVVDAVFVSFFWENDDVVFQFTLCFLFLWLWSAHEREWIRMKTNDDDDDIIFMYLTPITERVALNT